LKDIELPRRVIVGDGIIQRIEDIVTELKLEGNPLVLSGSNTKNIAGKRVSKNLNSELYIIKDSSWSEVEKILTKIKQDDIAYILGVGGGSIIDVGKVSAYKSGIPFISVPTAASHDGIASPQASLKGGEVTSVRVHSPLCVVVDTEVIREAPYRLNASGCADVISNYTAVLDWKLANRERGEYYGEYSATLAMMSAEIIMHNAERIRENINILVEALISSGVAIGIAGSSRPCSGSEHQFSHALDRICPRPALHGEQCGIGCIMMAYLHKAEWKKVRDSLKKIGAPTTARELGIEDRYVIEALTNAHKIRDRYTILRDGLSDKQAIKLAKVTGVI